MSYVSAQRASKFIRAMPWAVLVLTRWAETQSEEQE